MLGFMWVIWVYLVCACMIPFISNIKINKKSVSIIIAIYVCFELLSKTKLPENRFMYMSIFTIIPYGCMALLGYNLSKIRLKYGLEIGMSTSIGKGLYLGHAFNITINPHAVIGDNVSIHKGVLIGASNRGSSKGVPTIGNKVWIGCNAAIVGKINIGDDVLIAPNTYVNCNCPPPLRSFWQSCNY